MIEILRARRSIRQYEDKAIDSSSLEIMKEALLRCPSSRGLNSWTFIFVDDQALLHRLSQARDRGAQFLKDAALGIVICGDENRSDVWVEDCSIAATVVQLVATSLGLGTCWIQIRNRICSAEKSAEESVREILSIPETLKVECMISIGYPAEVKPPKPADQLEYGKIKYNGYR
jgi:nitroreductase